MKTIECCLLSLIAAATLSAPIYAQNAERRATLTGGGRGGDGKCTIEVYVDGAADVEIRGGSATLRTLSGQPAQWRRFECSGPLPGNTSEVRFTGIDGRGRQEVIQNQRGGFGSITVRIQDRDGGTEGYTFDLEWQEGGYRPGASGPPQRGRYQPALPRATARACEGAVRERAGQQQGLRNITFRSLTAADNPGRADMIVGAFDARQGGSRTTYRFACSLNLATGKIREVNISAGRGTASTDRYGDGNDATSACQRAAELRINRDGYRSVRFGWADSGNSRNGSMAGTATALRGDASQSFNFDIRCSVDLANGNLRSVEARRR